MPRTVLAALAALFLALPAAARCTGDNLYQRLAPEVRAGLAEAAAAAPFGRGLVWRARRGAEEVTVLGTYHLADPRHAALMARAGPLIDAASLVLVEAGPEEEAALLAALGRDPSLLFATSGPTLAERLAEAEWQALAAAMEERGVPAFLAAKFQPWYVATLLALSPCATRSAAAGEKGLDRAVIERATAAGVPVRALEPFDTALRIFAQIPDAMQIDMIRAGLMPGSHADDLAATLADAYFAEETRLIWEFSRHDALSGSGLPAESVDAQMALAETLLMSERNRAWIGVILPALKEGPVFLAAGALHLPGETGLLRLLEAEGFAIERLTP